nr:hypothetical protein [Tanacetum cinerariifolium]
MGFGYSVVFARWHGGIAMAVVCSVGGQRCNGGGHGCGRRCHYLMEKMFMDGYIRLRGFSSWEELKRRLLHRFQPSQTDERGIVVRNKDRLVAQGYTQEEGIDYDEIFALVKESPDASLVKELVSDDKLEKKTIFPTAVKKEFVRPKQQKKPVKPRPVNTARPNSAVVNVVRVNQIQVSDGLGTQRKIISLFLCARSSTKEYQGYIDSGCSTHMTGNMSYLSNFKEFNGGYVTFGGGAKGGRITSKGTLKTSKLDFKDVYFVKELKFTLLSFLQMCDKKNSVLFTDTGCFVLSPEFKLADESQVLLKVPRKNNMYSVDMKNIVPKESLTCLVAKATLDESTLWHRRLGHVNFKTINKLVKENLVTGLPLKRFENDQTCVACLKGKQQKASSSKDEIIGILKKFITEIENLVDKKVKVIKCDNRIEFKNSVMNDFCTMKGIRWEFSVARTPQQNGVVERRNKTLIEAARTMLADSKLPTTFFAEVVNTVCYVQNRVLVVKPHNKTHYELIRGRTPALSFMRPFGCHVTIFNTLDHLGNFDGKSDDGFFIGYSLNSKDFRVYNLRTRKVEENFHIKFLEDKPSIAGNGPKWLFDIDVLTKSMNYVSVVAGTNSNDFVGTEESIGEGHSCKEKISRQDYILMPLWKDDLLFDYSSKNASNDEPQPSSDAGHKDDEGVSKENEIDNQEKPANSIQYVNTAEPSINTASTNVNTKVDLSNISKTYLVPSTPNTRMHKDHSLDHVVGDVQSGVLTRRMTKTTNDQGFISAVYEGKTHEDLYTCLFACFLSPKKLIQALKDPSWIKAMAVGTKWIYSNKKDERGIVVRNKDRIKAIRLFLAYASFKDFILYQIDVKSAFLYGKIEEEVYVYQPPGFEDPDFPNKVYKVEKALYGLHQAPRAWKELCTEFEKLMHKKFQMSSMGEITFFLGLQVTQKNDGIFISQDKYVDETLKKFGFSTVKTASTPIETSKPLLKDTEAEDVDVHLYKSMIGSLMYLTASRPDIIDYAGTSLDRESTIKGCQFLGSRLISWQCKKQTVVANSTTEAKKKTHKLKRLYKIGSTTRVESFEDASLGDQEDVSKQGRMIDDLDADEGVALVDENQGRNDEDMFDTSIRDDEEVIAEKEVSIVDPVPTAGEVVTTAGVKAKDKGKAKVIEPEKPLKRKDQIMIDEEVAKNLEAQFETRAERSSKREGEELEYDKSKKQKLDKQIEAEVDNDKREAKMKMYIKRISDDEIAIDVISLATKPSIIVD